jgi:protein-S-isoprenylcysteine O-methyltransferase Ste14
LGLVISLRQNEWGCFGKKRLAKTGKQGRGTPHLADPPKELVASGPYRFTRSPQYLGVLSILAGHFVCTGALRLLPYSAMVAATFHIFVTYYEEPNLEKRFGNAYQRYLQQTPRWLGFIV